MPLGKFGRKWKGIHPDEILELISAAETIREVYLHGRENTTTDPGYFAPWIIRLRQDKKTIATDDQKKRKESHSLNRFAPVTADTRLFWTRKRFQRKRS